MGLPSRRKDFRTHGRDVPTMAAKGGRIGFKHGNGVEHGRPVYKGRPGKERVKKAEGGRIGFKKGTDKNWMQKVNKSIKKRGTKGKCTPITKPGCTGRAKALAKTFKKMAAKRKGKAEGGRIDVPPSSQWKKPADKNLKPGQAKDEMEQYKKQPKKLKLRCG